MDKILAPLRQAFGALKDFAEAHPSATAGVALALLCLYPILVPHQYYLRVLINVGLYVILAMGLHVAVGLCGLLDLGYIAFYGVGAYTAAIIATRFDLSLWVIVPVAFAAGGALAALVGVPTLKLRGDYLAIVTVGFAKIMEMSFTNLRDLTGGTRGIAGVSPAAIPFTEIDFTLASRFYRLHPVYYLVLAFVVVTLLALRRLEASAIGRAWRAIREDELAAAAMGIAVQRHKVLAYSFGAACGAMAGTLMATMAGFVAPKSFIFFESCMVLCMLVLGGLGNLWGAVLGAVVLGLVPEALRSIGLLEARDLVFGALMALLVVQRPQGLLGKASNS